MADDKFSYENSKDEYQFDSSSGEEIIAEENSEEHTVVTDNKIAGRLQNMSRQQVILLGVVVVVVIVGLYKMMFGGNELAKSKVVDAAAVVAPGTKKIELVANDVKAKPETVVASDKQKEAILAAALADNKTAGPSAIATSSQIVNQSTNKNANLAQQLLPSNNHSAAAIPAQPIQQPTQQSSNQQSSNQQSSNQSASIINEYQQMQTQVQQLVAAQQQSIQQFKNNQDQMIQQMNSLQSSQQRMIQQINTLSADFEGMANKIKQIEVAKTKYTYKKPAISTAKLHRTYHASAVKQKLFVEAVVPGRAWLQTTDGRTITVAVGERLSGYGRVVAIDPYTGSVRTSSGTIIQYGIGVN